MKKRNELLRNKGEEMSKVVKREKVAVLTKGTICDLEMLKNHNEPVYLMAVYELNKKESLTNEHTIGVCVIDTASAVIKIGQWTDDDFCNRLYTELIS